MAISENGFLRGCRGRIGDFVIYQCRGKTCIRQLPERGTVRMAPGMVEQQERIAGVAALYQAMKAVGVDKWWRHAAAGCCASGYHLLVRTNLQAFSGKGQVCDFQKVALTVGRLQLPDNMTIAPEAPEAVEGVEGVEEGVEEAVEEAVGEGGADAGADVWVVQWENNATPYPISHEDDRLVVALLTREKGFRLRIPQIGDWQRKHCRAVIRLPTRWRGYSHLYCYFCSATGEEVSGSRCFPIGR